MLHRLATLCLLLAIPSAAWAGSISGKITLAAGGTPGNQGSEIQLWQKASGVPPASKGYVLVTTTLCDASGNYAFSSLGAGSYKVMARGGPAGADNLGDRWYDTTGTGYVPDTATVITLASASDNAVNINIALQILGGMDGFISASIQVGQIVRAENTADHRVHHNDPTQDVPHLALYSFRGLEPGGVQLLAHDPLYRQDDGFIANAGTITNGTTISGPTLSMAGLPSDAYEGGSRNDTYATGSNLDSLGGCSGAGSGRCFLNPHSIFDSSSQGRTPFIGPINPSTGAGDVDFYCFSALAGDRFLITATAPLSRAGNGVESPFVDPTVSFWTGGVLQASDDDSLGSPWGAASYIDTRDLVTANGKACVAVSTYGDVQFNGHNNQSGGRYNLKIELGNRRPAISVAALVDNVSTSQPVAMKEAQTLELDVSFADPDSAASSLVFSSSFVDKNNQAVTSASVTRTGGAATLVWSASQTSARLSPYHATFSVSDGEFTASAFVDVNVSNVNVAPTMPVQLQPENGARVTTLTPGLLVLNATDVDQEPIFLDFEIYDLNGGTPIATATLPQDASGQTTWTPNNLPDHQPLFWRVRADDAHVNDNCCSPWTNTWELYIDTSNLAPDRPQMVKPADGETVQVRAPALAATSVTDPEGESVTLEFQVAASNDFGVTVANPVVPVSLVSPTTAANLPGPLPWDSHWYARVRATDARQTSSEWSDVIQFQIKPDAPPPVPTLVGDFLNSCQAHTFTLGPPPTVAVSRVEDPDGEAVSVEVRLYLFSQDPDASAPLYTQTQPQADLGDSTAVDLSQFTGWTEGAHYLVRARTSDGTLQSAWTDCDFSLVQKPVVTGDGGTDGGASDAGGTTDAGTSGDGGTGGDAGNASGDGGNGPQSAVAPSCGCTSGFDLGPLALVGLAFWRRRRAGSTRGAGGRSTLRSHS
ncbi:MAG: hypothetical protein JST92_18750 [Deltaproteobacteria bacterium]|nr:hypothetical protein [Deltaproteobacteria bacterium]